MVQVKARQNKMQPQAESVRSGPIPYLPQLLLPVIRAVELEAWGGMRAGRARIWANCRVWTPPQPHTSPPAPSPSPGFGLLFLSSDSDRFRPCLVRIRIGFVGPGSDSDRFRQAGFGFGSVSPGQVRIRIGFAGPGSDSDRCIIDQNINRCYMQTNYQPWCLPASPSEFCCGSFLPC